MLLAWWVGMASAGLGATARRPPSAGPVPTVLEAPHQVPSQLSTAYTSSGYTSRSSGFSSSSLVAPMYFEWELEVQNARKEEQIKHIKSLVHEFFCVPPANRRNINVGDTSVMERWFTELGVAWVLHLAADGASSAAGRELHPFDVPSWVRALAKIVETIRFTTSLFPDSISVSVSMPVVSEEEEPPTESEEQAVPSQFQFAHFFQETMLKMLAFVDLVVSEECLVSNGVQASCEKLSPLLVVLGALSKALPQVRLSSYSPPSALVQKIQGDMVSLFSAKEAKVGEAVWSKMEEIRSRVMESIEDRDDSLSCAESTPQAGSSGIHKATQTVASYIRFLRANYSTTAPIVSEATTLGKYAPRIQDVPPLDSMIVEMASCLEEKLATKSRAFSDQSLGFLFMLNNSHFILQQEAEPIWSAVQFNVAALDYNFLSFTKAHTAAVTRKIEGYMESYLHVSWTPVLSCLFNPTPLLFWENYSPLSKFVSDFQKTYNTQRLWKVPDPKLRKRLRKAVTEKIIPSYTKYIEDNKITTPKFSPQKLEEMVQEIFEG